MTTFNRRVLLALAITVCGIASGCGGSSNSVKPEISVLSSRLDMVTEGSALVQVKVPQEADVSGLKVALGTSDVTAQFQRTSGSALVGLVSGLQVGKNSISATIGGSTEVVEVINSRKNGPTFSGVQQTPHICTTDRFVLPDGTNLGPALDASCNAPTKVVYLYMPMGATALKVLPAITQVPADVSQVMMNDGRTANYIVRLETGTVDRAVYQIAMLFDPTKDKAPNAGGSFSGWNGKLIYVYGGGTGPGYVQGTALGAQNFGYMLTKGYAVASATLNTSGTYANDVVSAEVTSMVKEIFIKQFGVPAFTMGFGGSGGAIMQHLVANNYPGLLDGLLPSNSFPDHHSLFPPVQDCALLDRAFANSTQTWTDAQKAAVAGFATWKNCNNGPDSTFASDWSNSYNFLAAQRVSRVAPVFGTVTNCSLLILDSEIYDPVTNPGGVRCGIFDGAKTLLGIDPSTGYARRPWDNVGVQYGLKAMLDGQISLEQFVQLNEKAGGYDGDGRLQVSRTVASAEALNAAYAYGRVNAMQNLSLVPILDYRAYAEPSPNVHDFVRSFMARARLIKATGSAGNQVIWAAPPVAPAPGPSPTQPVVDAAIAAMDVWLTAIKKDAAAGAMAEKVIRNKPKTLVDGCFKASNEFVAEAWSATNAGTCGALYPVHADPRMVAGAPLTGDILKCQLRALQRSDYAGISDAQFTRLSAAFPTGVCDWTKPGVGSVPLLAPWLKYIAPGSALAM